MGLSTAQAREVSLQVEAEMERQEAIYFVERKREREIVQAQGCIWEQDEDYDENCDWVDRLELVSCITWNIAAKVCNMVAQKNNKKKADVAKKEYVYIRYEI